MATTGTCERCSKGITNWTCFTCPICDKDFCGTCFLLGVAACSECIKNIKEMQEETEQNREDMKKILEAHSEAYNTGLQVLTQEETFEDHRSIINAACNCKDLSKAEHEFYGEYLYYLSKWEKT